MHMILLIEDDHALNMGLSYALEAEGYQVISAKDLRLGEALLRDSQVDLLLLDGNLPDGDGFTFCKRVKEERSIPIILLTARDMDKEKQIQIKVHLDAIIHFLHHHAQSRNRFDG